MKSRGRFEISNRTMADQCRANGACWVSQTIENRQICRRIKIFVRQRELLTAETSPQTVLPATGLSSRPAYDRKYRHALADGLLPAAEQISATHSRRNRPLLLRRAFPCFDERTTYPIIIIPAAQSTAGMLATEHDMTLLSSCYASPAVAGKWNILYWRARKLRLSVAAIGVARLAGGGLSCYTCRTHFSDSTRLRYAGQFDPSSGSS